MTASIILFITTLVVELKLQLFQRRARHTHGHAETFYAYNHTKCTFLPTTLGIHERLEVGTRAADYYTRGYPGTFRCPYSLALFSLPFRTAARFFRFV